MNILDELLENNIDILSVAQKIAPNGKIVSNNYVALCPFHSEKTPSYHIDIHTGLSHCFGCGHRGDILKDFAELNHLSLVDAKSEILNAPKKEQKQEYKQINSNEQLQKAKAIWNKSIYDERLLTKYFRTRGLKPKKYDSIKVYHGTEAELYGNNKDIPITAMVSKIVDSKGNFKSLHITELTEKDGKITRGNKRFFRGLPVTGNFVAFGDISKTNTIAVAEGVETALSVKEALPNLTVLASLSASFMPSITLTNIDTVYIFADNDEAGIKAGKQLEARLKQEGEKVYVIAPKENEKDFNDILREQGISGILEAFNSKKETSENQQQNNATQIKISVMTKFTPRPIANELIKNYNMYVDKYNQIWLFDSETGLWIQNAENYLNSILRKKFLAEALTKKYVINETIEDIKGLLFENNSFPSMPIHLIPFKNGIFNIKTNELINYEPNHFATFKLPINYNEYAETPTEILNFLKSVVDDENILLELMSYCLWRDYPNHKIFFLYGKGGNGKSVFLNILTALLGKENTSSTELSTLIENKFAKADLFGKLANISADEKYQILMDTTTIKKLSGNDFVRAEQKFSHSFKFRNYAKLIVAANRLPVNEDNADAFFRRVYLIEFNNTFEGKNDNRELTNRLINNIGELEGLSLLLIEKLKTLRKTNWLFTAEKTIEEMQIQYNRLANPTVYFLENYTTYSSNVRDFIPKTEFQKFLNTWCYNNNIQPPSAKEISRMLKNMGYKDKVVKYYDIATRVWVGIAWKDDAINYFKVKENESKNEKIAIPF